ncbi:hypothetical protein [Flavobacterium sp. W20_MBD1_R3]|uniref:hypothetical protein n=1 Tax=Flavobacterium sp. W20_MBD1_R3 TaxID=3240278 RepID=UPI003F938E86
MKNLFLGLCLLAGTVSFANTSARTKVITKQANVTVVTKCYRQATDAFGNTYYKEVTCPKVVILQAVE